MDVSGYRSDIQEIIKELQLLQLTDIEATVEKCGTLLSYGENRRDPSLVGFAHFTLGEAYYYQNEIPMFYFEILKCIKPFEQAREWEYLANVYNRLGVISLNRGNAPLALDYYFKAYNYCAEHQFLDLQCKVQANIGNLYLSIDYPDEALQYFEESYKYLSNHSNMEGYNDILSAVIIGRGKAFFQKEEMENAWAAKNEAEQKCLPNMSKTSQLIFSCFVSNLAFASKDVPTIMDHMGKIRHSLLSKHAIMDIYDDVYSFMKMLIEMKQFDIFDETLSHIHRQIQQTTVKNLEKKAIALKLKALKEREDIEEYRKASEDYINLVEQMDGENRLMISSMINLRGDYQKLQEENKEEKRINQRLKRQSETDPVTAIANRLKLNDYAEVSFNRAITNGVGFAIELLDIDYFKEYNDGYGHKAGDECLLYIAKRITELSRNHQGVFCYRYDGDEFVIIYEGYTEQEVFNLAKELKNSILDNGLDHEFAKGDIKMVTISQGLYWGNPKDGDNVWEYLHEADQLLFKVKEKSRNSIMLGKAKHDEEKTTVDAVKPLVTILGEEESFPAPED